MCGNKLGVATKPCASWKVILHRRDPESLIGAVLQKIGDAHTKVRSADWSWHHKPVTEISSFNHRSEGVLECIYTGVGVQAPNNFIRI